jgi:hypothetical protein
MQFGTQLYGPIFLGNIGPRKSPNLIPKNNNTFFIPFQALVFISWCDSSNSPKVCLCVCQDFFEQFTGKLCGQDKTVWPSYLISWKYKGVTLRNKSCQKSDMFTMLYIAHIHPWNEVNICWFSCLATKLPQKLLFLRLKNNLVPALSKFHLLCNSSWHHAPLLLHSKAKELQRYKVWQSSYCAVTKDYPCVVTLNRNRVEMRRLGNAISLYYCTETDWGLQIYHHY